MALDSWDIALAVVAGYVAVSTLVRLMVAERDTLVARFRGEMEAERRRQKQLDKKDRKAEKSRGKNAAA